MAHTGNIAGVEVPVMVRGCPCRMDLPQPANTFFSESQRVWYSSTGGRGGPSGGGKTREELEGSPSFNKVEGGKTEGKRGGNWKVSKN